MKSVHIALTGALSLVLLGCANEPSMGMSVSQLRAEQTLNPTAWQENLGYLPEGSGERTYVSLEVYNNNGVAKE
ncbi:MULTISPECIES: hypothetical protein [Vibrio]|uniref:Uncharacterized protein n=1 Tax=Vibrio proteolyticus NBRC 13287 TaxID=1219065 RepID=U3A3P7_VIBPR|nr:MULTISPECIES: hypothetical protein [Vibrio]NAW59254.1 hypothetical protein [Vibrio sp. V36_P2S2PM302]NAX19993.1 hypothetical protein [Vibrio sp. V39_P1S14PM300]NAX27501.1 hypothetical protein [Vibrio sp. V38_P2S17PM301]NAX30675.1 hypothetical protein [Vibrio sp. V37_P2S8PM304]GAD67967.1 hypothetical protein VPR01S_10_01630 [Vibrio proteolyticus NBRC 13287]